MKLFRSVPKRSEHLERRVTRSFHILLINHNLQPRRQDLEREFFDLVPDAVAWKQKRNDDNGCS